MPELSPEERERIYQEEKARKEAQDKIKKEESAKTMKTGCIGCLGIIIVVFAIGLVASLFSPNDTSQPATSSATPPVRPAVPAVPPLQLLSVRGTIDSDVGYNTVQGQVKNVSAERLQNVEVVVNWYDSKNNFISSDSALIEYNPSSLGRHRRFRY
jgi:hypothetical protein